MSQMLSKSCRLRQLASARGRLGGCLSVAFCLTLVCASTACVKLPRRARAASEAVSVATDRSAPDIAAHVNINSATQAELERLPGIGPGLAARIIAHRARYGPFRRVEHLLIVRGISERRFAQLRAMVTAQ